MLKRVSNAVFARLNDLPHARRAGKGFTLIELLIVIAIILILIAIALPNFLEAQIRARATKAKGELRSLGIAMEAYVLDFKDYPAETEDDCAARPRAQSGHFWLTSPIKYIGSIPEDPFPQRSETSLRFHCYESGGVERGGLGVRCPQCMATWVIYSRGPSEAEPVLRSANPHYELGGGDTLITYNPTNGTRSLGTIHVWGGDGWWIGVPSGNALGTARHLPPITGPYGVGLPVDYVTYVHRLPPNLK